MVVFETFCFSVLLLRPFFGLLPLIGVFLLHTLVADYGRPLLWVFLPFSLLVGCKIIGTQPTTYFSYFTDLS